MTSEKTKLHHMNIGRIKLVALFLLHLAADTATTRPRNSILDKFLLLPSSGGCVRSHPYGYRCVLTSEKTKLRHIDIGHIKFVALF